MMATLVPLPAVSELPKVVVFHRQHPNEPVLVVQVPTGDTEEFETYRLRMDQPDHKRWLAALPNARDLTYKLTYEAHLAYFPHDGGMCTRLEDVEAPSGLQRVIAQMRSGATPEKVDTQFRRRHRNVPGVSQIRMGLSRGGRS